jgi:hypothetical protein
MKLEIVGNVTLEADRIEDLSTMFEMYERALHMQHNGLAVVPDEGRYSFSAMNPRMFFATPEEQKKLEEMDAQRGKGVAPEPENIKSETEQPDEAELPDEAQPGERLVDELSAKYKETKSLTLPSGDRVSAEDYVEYEGQTMAVLATYKGRAALLDEENKAHVARATDLVKVVDEPDDDDGEMTPDEKRDQLRALVANPDMDRVNAKKALRRYGTGIGTIDDDDLDEAIASLEALL